MPTIKIHDVTTNEVVEREMTADELVQWEADQTAAAAEMAQAVETAAARAALLDKLGITEDEARLLLS